MKHLHLLVFAAAVAFATVARADAPERILSVGGSTTEIVYALGAGDRLVGVDTTSLYPEAATHLPNVGYVRQLSAEGLLSLHPDVILAGSEAGPPNALAQVEKTGVKILRMSAGYTSDAVDRHIVAIGRELHREKEAAVLREAFDADMTSVTTEIAKVTKRPRVMFLLQAGRGAMLVSGKGTAADAMITLAGGENVVTGFDGYKPLSPEAAALAAPDVLLMTSDTVAALGGEEAVFNQTAITLTPAGRNHKLVTMDALYLAGFGPRLAHALHDLAAKLHPDQSFPALPERPWTR